MTWMDHSNHVKHFDSHRYQDNITLMKYYILYEYQSPVVIASSIRSFNADLCFFLAQSNYTNEPRNHDYQENTADEENEDDDEQDSLVDYPYSVSVQRKGAHYASGALVGERWVLSTAAEFYKYVDITYNKVHTYQSINYEYIIYI